MHHFLSTVSDLPAENPVADWMLVAQHYWNRDCNLYIGTGTALWRLLRAGRVCPRALSDRQVLSNDRTARHGGITRLPGLPASQRRRRFTVNLRSDRYHSGHVVWGQPGDNNQRPARVAR